MEFPALSKLSKLLQKNNDNISQTISFLLLLLLLLFISIVKMMIKYIILL
jgi:hypothetical protein